MIDFAKAFISQAVFLTAFTPDPKIRYKQEQAEEAFGSFISAQSQSTNLPDEFDPVQPRFIFQAATKQIFISQITSQLSMSFDNAHKPLNEQLGIVLNNSREFHKRAVKFKSKENLRESALVLSLNVPSNASREDLSGLLFDQFIKLPKFSNIASTSIKVGYQLPNDLFLNIEADVYEKRGGAVPGGQILDLMTLPIVEQGITIKLDVNSRPRAAKPGYVNDGPEDIIAVVNEYFPDRLIQLMQMS